jgi:hypothetical protein
MGRFESENPAKNTEIRGLGQTGTLVMIVPTALALKPG